MFATGSRVGFNSLLGPGALSCAIYIRDNSWIATVSKMDMPNWPTREEPNNALFAWSISRIYSLYLIVYELFIMDGVISPTLASRTLTMGVGCGIMTLF